MSVTICCIIGSYRSFRPNGSPYYLGSSSGEVYLRTKYDRARGQWAVCGGKGSTKRLRIVWPENVGLPLPRPVHDLVGHKSANQAKADKHADDPDEPAIRDSVVLPGDVYIHPPQTCPSPSAHVACRGAVKWWPNVPVITFMGSRTVPSAVMRESTLLIWLFASVISIEICAR